MAEISNRVFTGPDPVEADGNHFTGCTFDKVILVYRGGEHPRFDQCTFNGTGWNFAGAALKTIQLLQQIGASQGGETFVAQIFAPGVHFTD
jgi:hypothetical protein